MSFQSLPLSLSIDEEVLLNIQLIFININCIALSHTKTAANSDDSPFICISQINANSYQSIISIKNPLIVFTNLIVKHLNRNIKLSYK